jgi:hypothetical protein
MVSKTDFVKAATKLYAKRGMSPARIQERALFAHQLAKGKIRRRATEYDLQILERAHQLSQVRLSQRHRRR